MTTNMVAANLQRVATGLNKGMRPKYSLPVLDGILIDATGGVARCSRTDLEQVRTITIGYTGDDLRIVAHARQLADVLANCNEFVVQLSPVYNTIGKVRMLAVVSGDNIFRVDAWDAAEFPMIPQFPDGDPRHTFYAPLFQSAMRHVAVAAATDMTRPTFTGVFLSENGSGMELAATDGFRLHIDTLPSDSWIDTSDRHNYLIPGPTIEWIAGQIGNGEDSVEFSFDPGTLRYHFRYGPIELAVMGIDGKYPDYSPILRQPDNMASIRFYKRDLKNALLAVKKANKGRTSLAVFSVGTDNVTLSNGKPGGENTTLHLSIAANIANLPGNGNDDLFALNPLFLLDIINSNPAAATIDIRYTYGNQPLWVYADDRAAVVIPMNFNTK